MVSTSRRVAVLPCARLSLCIIVIFFASTTGSAQTKSPAVLQPSVMHPAFESAGKTAGLKIWRIEDFEPVPYPVKEYGKFYTGDSYIVLNSKEDKSKKGNVISDIFYWSGSASSQDEVGSAAILAVQLDDALGGAPVQHKETQDHESQAFLSLFSPSIRYLPGGVTSGFHHTEINPGGEKKLYQIKGKKNIRVKQVAPNVSSMNQGDCFILDTGKEIYLYVGPQAKGTERLKAISVANQIRDQDHSGRAKINIVDGSSTPEESDKFFKELGSGSAKQVAPAVDDDVEFEKKEAATPVLYKITDSQGGKISSEKLSQKPLLQSYLKTDDCFILDTVSSGVYVWIGKKGTTQEKVESLKRAQAFIKENNYPAWTRVVRVVEGSEPTAFKQYFDNWKENGGGIHLK
ncbi:actin depolymerising venom protein gelsolin 1-like [Adelges cooleyi]|uniref:actin depolymerising venom protein gelsolin 1-like n=1 Tax=Adelges cooleyi TaxID=133065 RepID=UPI0021806306|nr:actin depolymerising venom protein gelsolin 1-like [Adelges cooleyi]XP_050429101.1 actin depolymerising venom protein gelsolin 1-like [Adelges cooleyi]